MSIPTFIDISEVEQVSHPSIHSLINYLFIIQLKQFKKIF
jgi:hypothetical protein